jgi:hypothetical protein
MARMFADALITEDEVFTWYPSLAEEGFGNSCFADGAAASGHWP